MQFDQLKRGKLITLLGGAAAWPIAGARSGRGSCRLFLGRARALVLCNKMIAA
jgi:hypothetical protein